MINCFRELAILAFAIVATAGWAQSQRVGKQEHPGMTKIWNEVVMGYANTPAIGVKSVALYGDRTEVAVHINYHKGRQIGFPPNIILRADGKEYAVRDATIVRLGEPFTMPEDTLNLTMTFAPMPTDTKMFDFLSPDGLQLLNIRSSDEQPESLADTYWRNDATGDWLIGFTPKHVIYNNKVWDIVSQIEKKDTYTLTLVGGTTIKVGKMKKGLRTITITNVGAGPVPARNLSVVCSPITKTAMPDYPTKDSRTGFTDNGYNATDSVTIIGWLKDMPEQAWQKGREFSVKVDNIFIDDQESAFTKMDSLGRFRLRMPLINTSQAFLDWGRTSQSAVLEPGKTYFFLRDFKTGQTLWMGDDVRVQNELQAYPHDWNTDRLDHEQRGKVNAMDFKAQTDNSRAASMAKLQETIQKHPTLSQRYIDYVTGYYQTAQGESMMQARFAIPNFELPQEYMDYVGKEIWRKAVKPYTLYRDFSSLMRDYLDQVIRTRGRNGAENTMKVIRELQQQGIVTLTNDEELALQKYVPMLQQLEANLQEAGNSERIDSLVNAFNENETVKKVYALIERIGEPMTKQLATLYIREDLAALDSVGSDQDLRDIYLARRLYQKIDTSRQPLEPAMLEFAEKTIHIPIALNTITTLNNKYLAIMQRDITKSPSLKTADDVASMSDGEQILRKLIEPYKGRLILLDVWGTWCGPCKEMLSHSQEEYERLKDFDLVYLYLCNKSSDESWKNVIKEYNVLGDNVVHYNLPVDQQSAVEHFLNVQYFPTYKLIDRDGTVLDVNANPRDLEGLARLLEQMK